MGKVLSALSLAAALAAAASPQSPQRARVVLENAHVRAYRTTAGALAGVRHGAGVVIWLSAASAGGSGSAMWLDDVAVPPPQGPGSGPIVIIQPMARSGSPPPPGGSKPGEGTFTGISFVPLFENERVSVLRARMEADAREGFHTHGSDTIVVHLSGGEIEDTANGKTAVNRWNAGDVEFEALGSSHSARNVSHPVDAVLVVLKP